MNTLQQLICRLLAIWLLSAWAVSAATVTATFNSATSVPVTASSYTAAGNTVNLTLNFAPPVGTSLTVVKNTGLALIQGTFDNLSQGQRVDLSYAGIAYPFVANYFGGTGNDLLLQWANIRWMGWGANASGQLGNNSTNQSSPSPVDMSGVLAGKMIAIVSVGAAHTLALCTDGTLAAWGKNDLGQLGNDTLINSKVPVLVNTAGVLAGKTVVTIATGSDHNLAICSDGSAAAWGNNANGQLGNHLMSYSSSPVAVELAGALVNKQIVAAAEGSYHNLVLCADGTLAAWGANSNGQLGSKGTPSSPIPVLVDRSGVLTGKTISTLAAGTSHSLALCSDGSVAAWGANAWGQLGNGSMVDSNIPVAVSRSGVLSGKTFRAVAAGSTFNLALCTDGTLASWGNNSDGQLGNNSTTQSSVPVLVSVDSTTALYNKTVTAVAAAQNHGHALCSDGTFASWGRNSSGELGTGWLNVLYPVKVSPYRYLAGERHVAVSSGFAASFGFAMIAIPPPAVASTLAATSATDTGATLNGSASSISDPVTVSFEYGLTTAYGSTVAATPAAVIGPSLTAISATLSSLPSNTTYHYRIVAVNSWTGTVRGADMTFTTLSADAQLAALELNNASVMPAFAPIRTGYTSIVPYATTSTSVTPVSASAAATIKVNAVTVASGMASDPINLSVGNNVIRTEVSAADGTTKTYSVTVIRMAELYHFTAATTVPVTAEDFRASGLAVNFSLGYTPTVGTDLTVVKITGTGLIQGVFDNLAQGQRVELSFGGITYAFVANYFGGTGNDLVLQWAYNRPVAWGYNESGQLGNGGTTTSLIPVPVDRTGVLAGKTITGLASGSLHSLALCSDGTLAAWGKNDTWGALGNNSMVASSVPVAVNRSGVLAGRTVVAIAAGSNHCLALCADGMLVSWGKNEWGCLGIGALYTTSRVPNPVNRSGVLAGKTITQIAAGGSNSYVLCSDGTVAAWGNNYYGQVGNNSTENCLVPVMVDRSGVLAGKTVVTMEGGRFVLCSDNTMVTWGDDQYSILGNSRESRVPVVTAKAGALSGKTITSIIDGGVFRMALCADGTLAAWGSNSYGQLGNNSTIDSYIPVAVLRTGALAGKTITGACGACAGGISGYALCSDGTLTAWGLNTSYGVLGNNSTTSSMTPVATNMTALRTGERFVPGFQRTGSYYSVALVASPPPPTATTLAAGGITATGATLKGSVNAAGATTTISFEYGLTTAYGTSVTATPTTVSGSVTVAVAKAISGLVAGTTYHYRVVATSASGTTRGADMAFTASNPPVFAGYSISTPFQTAANVSLRKLLARATDPDGDVISVTAAGPASTHGGLVLLQASGILYTPPAGFSGSDTFSVTLTDSGGAARSGRVTATVGPGPAAGGATVNPPQITLLPGGEIGVKFQGIPGRTYRIQRSTDMSTWANLATVTANASGAMTFTDEAPPQPSAYYRLALP